jgi:hypothetical protein
LKTPSTKMVTPSTTRARKRALRSRTAGRKRITFNAGDINSGQEHNIFGLIFFIGCDNIYYTIEDIKILFGILFCILFAIIKSELCSHFSFSRWQIYWSVKNGLVPEFLRDAWW